MPRTGLPVTAKQRRQLAEQVGLRPEVADIGVPRPARLRQPLAHLHPVVAMEASPSMSAGASFSRRKICSKVFVTVVVPAPEEPVIGDDRMSDGHGVPLASVAKAEFAGTAATWY